MYDIESNITDEQTRQVLLGVLKERLAKLQGVKVDSASAGAGLTKKNSAEFGEPTETALQRQQSPPETGVSSGESSSLAAESGSPPGESDSPATARKFAIELDKLDPQLREVASDLFEHLHYRSNFSKLTTDQRDAILELLKYHSAEKVVQIVSQPPPIGFDLQTSKPGINRFREDYMRCAMEARRLEAARKFEEQQALAEREFQTANASDESFSTTAQRHIRKRVFNAVRDPKSDYHEIRWLLKSLQMLRDSKDQQ